MHKRSISHTLGLRFKSDSETTTTKTNAENSLPIGEYLQHKKTIITNKNLIQLEPIHHRKPSVELDSATIEEISSLGKLDLKSVRRRSSLASSDNSEHENDSQSGSGSTCNTPKKKQSLFSTRKIIDISKLGHLNDQHKPLIESGGTYTPTIGKKKNDLYRISILSQFAKNDSGENGSGSKLKQLTIKSDCTHSDTEENKDSNTPNTENQNTANKFEYVESKNFKPKMKEEIFDIKRLVFSTKVEPESLKRHVELILKGLNYSLNLLKAPPISYIQSKQITLRDLKKKNMKTILLDLDETLISACTSRDNPDKTIVLEQDSKKPTISIKIRPYARELLMKLKDYYEIILFTASTSPYAEAIAQELDPEKKLISYILDRKFCLETKNGFFIKDLRLLKNRQLKNILIVDNLVHSFGFQIDNGVPILEWTGNKKDNELKYLADYLMEARKYDDVREYNKERFRLSELSHLSVNNALDLL